MSITVFPLVPSWPQTQGLSLDTYVADYGDGFEKRACFSQTYARADGEGHTANNYRGRNEFTVKFNAHHYPDEATTLWAFFQARKANIEAFYFYNVPDECAGIDLTGASAVGRYLVRFKDAMMSRTKFTAQLYTTGLNLVEVRT